MHKAFTLAEVLIALALLGVVAAFTIPKVLQATGEQEKISKLKEASAMFSEVTYASALKNDLNPLLDPHKIESATPNNTLYVQNLMDYFERNLNTLKKCYNAQAEGCWTGSTDPVTLTVVTPTAAGLILPNGVYAMDFEDHGTWEYGDAVYLDYNGPTGPNKLGEDIMGIRLHWKEELGYKPGSVSCPGNADVDINNALKKMCNLVYQ